MQNEIKVTWDNRQVTRIKRYCVIALSITCFLSHLAYAEDMAEQMSADAVAAYDVNGSLFQQITDLEQEKVLMQLEKERAQLDLELDRLAAEKIKLHMEIDTLAGRAEEQQAAIDNERAKLQQEAARLERERTAIVTGAQTSVAKVAAEQETPESNISEKYELIEIIGAGTQLQATLRDLQSGQSKRISVGRDFDGYTVKSISLDEGIVFDKDGQVETLNIGMGK